MTKKIPRKHEEIEKELDELWKSWKEIGTGKYKNESAEFRRDLRFKHKQRFTELYDEMADRDLYERGL